MKQISELLRILGDRPLLAPDNKIGGQVRRLAKWLRDQPDANDKAAQVWLKIPEGSSAFRKIKHHFRIYLLNSISATHTAITPEDPNRSEANEYIWNQLGPVMAGGEGRRNSEAHKKLYELMGLARAHDLQDPLTIGEVVLHAENQGAKNAEAIQRARTELYNGYVRGVTRKHTAVSTFMNKTRVRVAKKVEKLEECIEEIESFSKFTNPFLEIKKLYLEIKISLYESDLEKTIKIHESAIEILKLDEGNKHMLIVNFHANLIRCYLKSEKLQEGNLFAKQILIETKNYRSQYILLELSLIMAMKAEDYDFAVVLYSKLVNHPRYKIINDNDKETVWIIQAYLSLLVSANKIKITEKGSPLSNFKIYRFLNDLTFSQKEKSFRNTHAIIIKVIDHCINKKDKDFELTESIKKYIQRHLNDPINKRTKNFILSILQHPKHGFNIKRTKKHASKYLKIMRSNTESRLSQHAYIEIIPYETIWQIITHAN